MRLYLKSDNPKKEKWIDVDFWSFFKCAFFVGVALNIIVFIIFFILGFIFELAGL